MPKTKKKFIDKKKSVTFNLVHRSQKDPLIADETAPQRVLVPVNANVPSKKEPEKELTPEQRKLEQQKYGIYFDDDYNYLRHLKDTREVTLVVAPKPTHKRNQKDRTETSTTVVDTEQLVNENIKLPSSVFASEVEEDVGLLNKAATQGLCLDLDPDVVAALDEDFDFEDPNNELEDNFIELAMGDEGSDVESDNDSDDDEDEQDMSDEDDVRSDRAFASDNESDNSQDSVRARMPMFDDFEKEETKSRFSQYSMSSSVIRRNEGLSLLDSRFEKMFSEYDETEMGALDCDEIEGFMPSSHRMLLQAAEEYENTKHKYRLDKEKEIARITRLQEIAEEESSSESDVEIQRVGPDKKWDCESILSTYSNLYNHPKLIQEPKKLKKIKINTKTGLPADTLGNDTRLTAKTLARFNAMNEIGDDNDDETRTVAETVLSTLSVLSIRPKEESPEEKKERKRLLKQYRAERRIEKKANKEAFKEEKKRQEKIMSNNRNNVQGNRIL